MDAGCGDVDIEPRQRSPNSPNTPWESAARQVGTLHDTDHSAVRGVYRPQSAQVLAGGHALIVRRVRPSDRHTEKLADLEKKTGRKYSVIATNITKRWGVAGCHVEVAYAFPAAARRRKSTHSNGEGGDCVEVADEVPGVVPVRYSKAPGGPVLEVGAGAWAEFVRGRTR